MSEVIYKHIHLENFCNHKEFDADFPYNAIVSGYNKQGKSSILNAILVVLTGKLANNADAGDSIRPHDLVGNRIDNVEVRIDLTVGIDKSEYVLTMIQKQKWVKKRGNEEAEFQGNENVYEISGIPKRAKDFKQFIDENICPVDVLNYCVNPNAFLSHNNKDRRALVLGLAKSFTDDDVIASDPRFEELRNDLKIGTIDDLMKRSKQTNTALKKTLEELPARIDEVSKQIVDYDFSSLELERNALNEELAKIAKKEEEKVALNGQIMQAKFDLSEIENRLTSDVKEKQNNIRVQIIELNSKLRSLNDDIAKLEGEKEKAAGLISNNETAIKEAEKQMQIASDKVFDGTSMICSKCGQPLPFQRIEELKNDFEKSRQDEMSRLADYMESLKNGAKNASDHVTEYESKIIYVATEKSEIEKQIQEKENEAAQLIICDPTKDSTYKAKMDEITALQSKSDEYAQDDGKSEINAKIKEIESKLAQAEANNRAEERIEHLKAEKKIVAQNILNQERIIALLEDYNRAKIAMLEDSVNSFFEIIKWRFFEKQINGSYSEVCKATVDGEDYDRLLNKSDRLLCQLDLIMGFQKAYGVALPLLMDDTESVDADRIPKIDGHQMILFMRDDNELRVDEWS